MLLAAAMVAVFAANAQRWLIYETFSDGSSDTSRTLVATSPNQNAALISSADPEEANPIPGIAKHFTYIDYKRDTVFYQLYYSKDEKYYTGYSLNNSNEYTLEKTEKINGYNCKKYTTSLFSNKMEIWVTEDMKNHRGTPSASFGNLPGVVVQIVRNGNTTTRLASVEKYKDVELIIPDNLGQYTDRRAISNLEKEKLVITIPVFRDAQICFNPKLPKSKVIPFDTVLPYSNGTIILKRMNLKQLPPHYQLFAELTEQSNGDAYDRTGSIFVIPASQKVNFLNALIDSVGVLPVFTDKNGAQYQGIKLENDYTPLVELVRFFTPFGVHHFNQYRSLNDKEWEDAAFYKQDVSDLRQYLQGDVYIGAFIGNYDAGGHKVTLDLKAYPESYEWTGSADEYCWTLPLFNTCNAAFALHQYGARRLGHGRRVRAEGECDSHRRGAALPSHAVAQRLRHIPGLQPRVGQLLERSLLFRLLPFGLVSRHRHAAGLFRPHGAHPGQAHPHRRHPAGPARRQLLQCLERVGHPYRTEVN